ncbi:MAG: hypothetical protein ACOYZ6_04155 [Chloroflexota bacterium]
MATNGELCYEREYDQGELAMLITDMNTQAETEQSWGAGLAIAGLVIAGVVAVASAPLTLTGAAIIGVGIALSVVGSALWIDGGLQSSLAGKISANASSSGNTEIAMVGSGLKREVGVVALDGSKPFNSFPTWTQSGIFNLAFSLVGQ